MQQLAVSSGVPTKNVWRLSGNAYRYVVASVVLFLGLSVANAFGSWMQVVFYGCCLAVVVGSRHRVPVADLVLAFGCGMLALLASFRAEPSVAPFVKFTRPFVEGYLLAFVLYRTCRIRTFRSLMIVLGGYVLIEFISVCVMVVIPDIRSELLDLWYSDDTYQQETFLYALIFRGYGVSRHHLYGLPLAMGTVSAMLLVAGSLRSPGRWRTYFMAAAFCGLPVVLLNARIGLIPVVLCYVLGTSVFFNRYYFKHLAVLVFVLLPALFLLAQSYLGDTLDIVFEWQLEGMKQFLDPSAAADSTTVSDLSGMVILPASWSSWLIGDGRVCLPGEACYTDIGWLRLLQEGGLVLLSAVVALYLRAILSACRWLSFAGFTNCNRSIVSTRHLLFCVLVATFVAATIKGDSFGANEYSRLIMLLGVLSRLARPKNSIARKP
jgi:hypothetical protein